MHQNHLTEMLALIAMDLPPRGAEASGFLANKLELLRSTKVGGSGDESGAGSRAGSGVEAAFVVLAFGPFDYILLHVITFTL